MENIVVNKEIIVVNKAGYGDIVFADTYKTAVEALIKENWINCYTEANDDYYGGSNLEELLGNNWKDFILDDWALLEDFNIVDFKKVKLYLSKKN